MNINQNIKNLPIYNIDLLDESIKRCHGNESDSPIISESFLAKNLFENINYYPENIYNELTKNCAKFYKTKEEYSVPVNGSDEGLDLITRTFSNYGDSVVLLNPTFSMYKRFSTISSLNISEFNLNENFELEVDEFINFCNEKNPVLILIPNPLAPTGNITKIDNLIKIIENLPKSFIVIDEAYIEFSEERSMIEFIEKYQNLIVTRTLSKFFGLAGIRLGFVFTKYKNEILKIKTPYNVNSLTSKIGTNLFNNLTKNIMIERYTKNIKNKQEMLKFLSEFQEIDKIFETKTNFFFIKLKSSSESFEKKLLSIYEMKIKSFSDEFANFCRIGF